MIDLAQCHWVVDENQRLYLASAPSLRAPFRFDCFVVWNQTPRRLSSDEAQLIGQASMDAGMLPMTFINSNCGIDFIHGLMVEQARAA